MKTNKNGYRGYRFPREIISHSVWLYHRLSLNFRDVEELLAKRGTMEAQQHIVERRPITIAGHELGHFLDHRTYGGDLGDLLANPLENVLRSALQMGPKGKPIRP